MINLSTLITNRELCNVKLNCAADSIEKSRYPNSRVIRTGQFSQSVISVLGCYQFTSKHFLLNKNILHDKSEF